MADEDDLTPDLPEAATRARLGKRKLLIGAAIVTALGVAIWPTTKLLELMTKLASERATDCVNAIFESGEGDPADCRQRRVGFWLARVMPTTREGARQEQADIESMVLEYQLDFASMRDFDVEARDQAARELVELYRGEYVPDRAFTSAFGKLDEAGAHELMVELVSERESGHARNLAMKTALFLGDWESAERIARMPAAGDPSLGQNAAIVACILGDRETAATRLREADAAWRAHEDSPWRDLLLIEVHCDLPRTSEGPLDSFTASSVQRLVDLYSPDNEFERAYDRHEQAMIIARTAVAPRRPIVWDKTLREDEVEWIEEIGSSTELKLVPVTMRTHEDRPGAGGPVIVTELEAGARSLAELFATAPSEHTFERHGKIIRPRESLAWGGFCLATMAAAERVWRGQMDEARAIYQVARELAASEDFRAFGLAGELAVLGLSTLLDPETALRLAGSIPDADLAATPAMAQVLVRIQLAAVYEQAGEHDRAFELVAGAVELLAQIPANDLTGMELDAGARWVHGALLLRNGRESSLTVNVPEDPRGRAPSGSEIFGWWWNAALAESDAQFRYRWQASGESKLWLGLPPWALASALELLAHTGPADHRELWLDSVSSDMIADPLDMIRARGVAAERLGDATAAERWRGREAALLERLQDDRAAALYRMLD